MPEFSFKILKEELLNKIDLYKKMSRLYRNFYDLVIESLVPKESSDNFILIIDTLNERLKRFFINHFNIQEQADIVEEIYEEMRLNFPKYLTKQFSSL